MVQTGFSSDRGATQVDVILSLGRCRLMLPQSEIRLLESALDVQTLEPPPDGLGWLPFDGRQWPVYGLDEGLNPLSDLPMTYRICALVNRENGYFGLVCTDIVTVDAEALDVRPLPVPMIRPNSPVCGLAREGDEIVLVSQSEVLAEFLGVVGSPVHAEQS